MLLLDEPLSALDAKVRVQLRDEIRRVQLDVGTTTLFVTHDQEEALAVADRVGVMNAGRLDQIAPPTELYARPATRFVAEFVGLSNKLRAEVSGGAASVLGHRVALLDGSLEQGAGQALVRPESVDVTAAGGGRRQRPGGVRGVPRPVLARAVPPRRRSGGRRPAAQRGGGAPRAGPGRAGRRTRGRRARGVRLTRIRARSCPIRVGVRAALLCPIWVV